MDDIMIRHSTTQEQKTAENKENTKTNSEKNFIFYKIILYFCFEFRK